MTDACFKRNPFIKLSYLLLGEAARGFIPFSKRFEEVFDRSGLFIAFEAYCALTVFASIFASILTASTLLSLKFLLNWTTPPSSLTLTQVIGLSVTSFLLTYGAFIAYPLVRGSYVSGKIDERLFLTANLLRVMTATGMPLEEVIERTAEAVPEKYTKIYLSRVIRNVRFFGMGLEEAIEEALRKIPSRKLANLIHGTFYAMKTVGDPSKFLEAEVEKLHLDKRRSLEKKLSSLAFFGEFYVSLLIVAPIIFILIISTLSILGSTFMGLPVVAWLNLIIFILIPIFAASLVILLDSIVGEW